MKEDRFIKLAKVLGGALLGLLLCFILTLCFGCTRKVYVPTETVKEHYDTIYKWHWSRDTIIQKDSIHIERIGDTVRIDKYRNRTKIQILKDTVYTSKRDTITVTKQIHYPESVFYKHPKFRKVIVIFLILSVIISIFYLLKTRIHR